MQRSLREIYEELLRDAKQRKRVADIVRVLFEIFLSDWFRWEIFGWVIALFLGFNEKEILERPELGWFAKAAAAAALMQSPKRKERLLGRALLYHTELPPKELFVRHGGSLMPAIIYHYRTSAQDAEIIQEAVKIAQRVERMLSERRDTNAGV